MLLKRGVGVGCLIAACVTGSSHADIHVPQDFPTIQAAINAAIMPGETIRVAPGTYIQNIDYGNKILRIISTGGPEVTVIQGVYNPASQGASAVQIAGDHFQSTVLEGFTIRGGFGRRQLVGNTLVVYGGGLYVRGGPVIRNCIFDSNIPSATARGSGGQTVRSFGGAVYSAPATTFVPVSPRFENCVFRGNQVSGDGGAVYLATTLDFVLGTRVPVQFVNCTFRENVAGNSGGAIFMGDHIVIVSNTHFLDNTAGNRGGAVAGGEGGMNPLAPGFFRRADLEVRGATLIGNAALNGSDIDISGALRLSGQIQASGDFHLRGRLRTGAEATLDLLLGGNLVSTTGLTMSARGREPGVTMDRLVIGGDATIGCGLTVQFMDGLNPEISEPSIPFMSVSGTAAAPFGVVFAQGLPTAKGAYVQTAQRGSSVEAGIATVYLGTDVDLNDPQDFEVAGVPRDAVAGNFNDDDFLDLALVMPALNRVFVLFNNGLDASDSWTGFDTSGVVSIEVGESPTALARGQLDLQPLDDLATANTGGNSVSVLLNLGGGVFEVQPPISVGQSPRDIVAAELDGIFPFDLAVMNAGDNTLTTIFGAHDRGLVRTTTIPVGDTPVALAAADMDAAEGTDLVIAHARVHMPDSIEADILWLLSNDGAGGFQKAAVLTVGRGPGDVLPEDLDNDKDQDLVIPNAMTNSLTFFLNMDNRGFSEPMNVALPGSPIAMVPIDADSDGDMDFAVVIQPTSGTPLLRILRVGEVNGQVTIALDEAAFPAQDVAAIVAADVDNNGEADLLAIGGSTLGGRTLLRGESEGAVGVMLSIELCPLDIAPEPIGDDHVDLLDVLAVIQAFGTTCAGCAEDLAPPEGDGTVSIADIVTVLVAYGSC